MTSNMKGARPAVSSGDGVMGECCVCTGVAFRECLVAGAPGDVQSPGRDGKGEHPYRQSFMGLTSSGGVAVDCKLQPPA
jgi:hypothetical protein